MNPFGVLLFIVHRTFTLKILFETPRNSKFIVAYLYYPEKTVPK